MEASAVGLSADRLETILEDGEFAVYRSDDSTNTTSPRSSIVVMPRSEHPRPHAVQMLELLITVSDTGVGLPVENPDQIFESFVTTKPHGTGMGLAISRAIVEAHGGRLWATANTLRGATFLFTLPGETAESVLST